VVGISPGHYPRAVIREADRLRGKRFPLAAWVIVAALVIAPSADARPSSHSSSHLSGAHSATHHSGGQHAAVGVKRDAHGKIARDPHAKEAFRKSHPCPATGKTYGACPGWVVDHVHALKHGGADDPSNMQWQTQVAAKAKDRWE